MRKQKMNELEEDARNEQNLLKTTPIAIEAHCFESAKKRSMHRSEKSDEYRGSDCGYCTYY